MTRALAPAPGTAAPAPVAAPVRRIPPNLFAVSFGLAGLAQAWSVAARFTAVPHAVIDALWLLDGAVWLVTLVLYVRSVSAGRRWRAELDDHVLGPFVSVPAIVGMLLAGGLLPHARIAALVLLMTSLAVALVLAGGLLAVWTLDDTPSTQWHPGYYLPSVGAPFVGAAESAAFGLPALGRLLFGIGVLGWVLVGAIVLHHLVGRPRLPAPLVPTLAILIAPPVVAGNAWFALHGLRADDVALGLAGYAVLMAVVQVALIPAYRTAPFGPGWWSFSFPFAATAGNAILWVAAGRAPHPALWVWPLLGAITAFVAYLAVRTVLALARHAFLPRPALTVVP